jgi:hypothetical protein
VQADGDGIAHVTLTMPDLNAGVHSLLFSGHGADGVGVTQRTLLELPGRPTRSYATYLGGFSPELADIPANEREDQIDVTVDGVPLGTYRVDEEGGVLVHVPVIVPTATGDLPVITATSRATGKVTSREFDPVPVVSGIWATSGADAAVDIGNSDVQVKGIVHSNGGTRLTGVGHDLTGGTEYVTRFQNWSVATQFTPGPRRVTPTRATPATARIEDYRPGGATSSIASYHAVDSSACKFGWWTPSPFHKLTGIVYVPCNVNLTGFGTTIDATIAAEGRIVVTGTGMTVRPSAASIALFSAATGPDAVTIRGAGNTIAGTIIAPAGTVTVTTGAALTTIHGGVLADTVRIYGPSTRIDIEARR